jgi:hypothetical protein
MNLLLLEDLHKFITQMMYIPPYSRNPNNIPIIKNKHSKILQLYMLLVHRYS